VLYQLKTTVCYQLYEVRTAFGSGFKSNPVKSIYRPATTLDHL